SRPQPSPGRIRGPMELRTRPIQDAHPDTPGAPQRRVRDPGRLWAVMAAMAVAGILSMAYYYNHYGQLLHGWDAQFYYATARSFLFGRTADITDALKETPWTSPFDRDGNGSLERVPLRED